MLASNACETMSFISNGGYDLYDLDFVLRFSGFVMMRYPSCRLAC